MDRPEFSSINTLGKRVRRICIRRGLSMKQAAYEAGFTCAPNFFNTIAGRVGHTRGNSKAKVLAWVRKNTPPRPARVKA